MRWTAAGQPFGYAILGSTNPATDRVRRFESESPVFEEINRNLIENESRIGRPNS
jgi:hypothetical protein